ncbi:MAG: GGDEF domain-containing protein [Candidatus Hydrogenedentota bacterium]
MITAILSFAVVMGILFGLLAISPSGLLAAALAGLALLTPDHEAGRTRVLAAVTAILLASLVAGFAAMAGFLPSVLYAAEPIPENVQLIKILSVATPLPAIIGLLCALSWMVLFALQREVDLRGHEEADPIVEQLSGSTDLLGVIRNELTVMEAQFRIQAERHEAVRAFGSSLRFEEAWHDIERGATLLLQAQPVLLIPPLCQGIPEGVHPAAGSPIDIEAEEWKEARAGRRRERDMGRGVRAFWIPLQLGDQNRIVVHFKVDTTKILADAIGIFIVQVGLLLEKIRLYYEVELQSRTDLMTGLPHQAGFKHHLGDEFARAERTHRPLTLLMADVDHFKSVNDTYGHLVGDQVLMHVARKIKETVRISDLPCRYGGEEFAVILVETPREGAREIAERIRVAIENHQMLIRTETGEQVLRKTISVGVATWPLEGVDSAASLLECADKALYQAKRGGRNQVVHFGF